MQYKPLAAATAGHALSDGFVNLVPPLWYEVRRLFALSNARLGSVQMAFSLVTNFGQLLFGYLIDRKHWHNVVGLGIFISAVFTCTVGFMPNLWSFVAILVASGVGTALFHPQGAALAAQASGTRRAFGMSIFGMGGAVGYAAGAVLGPWLHQLGLEMGMGPMQGFIFVLPFGLLLAFVLHSYSRGHSPQAPRTRFQLRQHVLPYWRSLTPVLIVMVLRSMTVVAYASFFQVIMGDRGFSEMQQGWTLFWFVFGGAIGGMLGAHLSDSWGRRFMTVGSLLVSPPLLYYSLQAPYSLALALLFFSGFTLRAAESVNIAQTQDIVPHGMSMASSIGMGLAWGLAGIIAPIVGLVSDHTGSLTYALSLTVILPVVAAAVALVLPTRPVGEALPGASQ